MDTLVVAVDFSKPSRKAFDAAVGLAKGLKANLVLVHAVAPAPRGAAGHRGPVEDAKAEIEVAEWKRLSADWVKEAKKSVPAEAAAREGKAADVILAVAKERKATLIVVGSHGRTGIKRAVLGSVAEAIVHKSTLPVVVVPA